MSGILRKKKYCALVAVCIADIACLILFMRYWIIWGIINAVTIIIFLANRQVYKMMYQQKIPFGYTSRIRNVDYLVIGDMFDPKAYVGNKSFVQIKAPGRTLNSSFEILKHTSSILDEENGTVIIAVKQKNVDVKDFSVFDMPFFVNITIKKYGLDNLKRMVRFPLITNPIKSINLLIVPNAENYVEQDCPNRELKEFCGERDMKLIYVQH